jgi:hypothetical protein
MYIVESAQAAESKQKGPAHTQQAHTLLQLLTDTLSKQQQQY